MFSQFRARRSAQVFQPCKNHCRRQIYFAIHLYVTVLCSCKLPFGAFVGVIQTIFLASATETLHRRSYMTLNTAVQTIDWDDQLTQSLLQVVLALDHGLILQYEGL